MRPRQLSGRGSILTFTVVHQPADGFELQSPYVIALVELAEGCRVMSQVVNVEPGAVHTGLAVEACFRRIREDGKHGVIYYGYKFRPIRTKTRVATSVVMEATPRGAATSRGR